MLVTLASGLLVSPSMSFRGSCMSLMYMCLESVSEQTPSSDKSEPMYMGLSDSLGLSVDGFGHYIRVRHNIVGGPELSGADSSVFARDISYRRRQDADPALGAGHLVFGSDELPELASLLALSLLASWADDRWEALIPLPGVMLRLPTGTKDSLFCFDATAFLSSLRAGENSSVEITLIKSNSSCLIMVLWAQASLLHWRLAPLVENISPFSHAVLPNPWF